MTAIRNINSNFDAKFDKYKYKEILNHTEILNIPCEEYRNKKDTVLILRK